MLNVHDLNREIWVYYIFPESLVSNRKIEPPNWSGLSNGFQWNQGFRDTKNQQYGIGLAQAKSKSAKRYNNLLLVAALTQFLLWCIGKVAVNKKYHYDLQANTIRHRTVLSNVYIGIQIVRDKRYKIKKKEIKMVFENISNFTQQVVDIC